MKIADLKRSFTPVLDMIIQLLQNQGGSLKWQHQYNLSCDQDLFQAKEELLLPFLKNLHCTFTDSQIPSQHDSANARIQRNIKIVLEEPEISDKLKQLSGHHIALFQMVSTHILGINDPSLTLCIQALIDKQNLNSQQVCIYKCRALTDLNQRFNLGTNIPSAENLIANLSKEVGQLNAQIRVNQSELDRINSLESSLADKEQELATEKQQFIQSQRDLLIQIAKLYISGSPKDQLKKHNKNYFDKIFKPHVSFNHGDPKITSEDDEFEFGRIIGDILFNCAKHRTLFARMGQQLQAGKFSDILIKQATAASNSTGLKIISGGIRKEVHFYAEDISHIKVATQKLDEAKANFLQEEQPQQLKLPQVISALQSKKKAFFKNFEQQIDKHGHKLGCAYKIRASYPLPIENSPTELASQTKSSQTTAPSLEQELNALLDTLEEELAKAKNKDQSLDIILRHIADIDDNSSLRTVHSLLAKHNGLVKHKLWNTRSTTMYGDETRCSTLWEKIEQAFAKRMFANLYKESDTLNEEKIATLIEHNPFLKRHHSMIEAILNTPVTAQLFSSRLAAVAQPAIEPAEDVMYLYPLHR
ncbi:hypothetical protein [Piscirickettsia salmonis]|uniref:hypothetical protein n=1 Tax=Piscirickettsia salmonis TaxID=1238 RepID=UPI0007C96951|nr:hypothetical protein A0O36_01678 [Piscirickettsiaceae bacterium NZ-RLO1]